jgi:endoglycosylceramidase
MNVPVIVGEWGAFHGDSEKLAGTAKQVLGIFEKNLFSNTYWAYYKGIEKEPYFNQSLIRPFPEYISGNLLQYSFNAETREFICSWEENELVKSPTVIYVPTLKSLPENEVKMDDSGGKIAFEYFDNSVSGKLIISPMGKKASRSVRFKIP